MQKVAQEYLQQWQCENFVKLKMNLVNCTVFFSIHLMEEVAKSGVNVSGQWMSARRPSYRLLASTKLSKFMAANADLTAWTAAPMHM